MDVDHDMRNGEQSAGSPSTGSMPGSFTPQVNGVNGNANGIAPVPPPHKSNPPIPAQESAPAGPTAEDAEAFKTAGNKFYKAGEYAKAIDEYTKGRWICLPANWHGVNID